MSVEQLEQRIVRQSDQLIAITAERDRLKDSEDQLCRIARALGADATQAPKIDPTIAGATIDRFNKLVAALRYCEFHMVETSWPKDHPMLVAVRAVLHSCGCGTTKDVK